MQILNHLTILISELFINLLDRIRHEYCRAYHQISEVLPRQREFSNIQIQSKDLARLKMEASVFPETHSQSSVRKAAIETRVCVAFCSQYTRKRLKWVWVQSLQTYLEITSTCVILKQVRTVGASSMMHRGI